MLRKIRNKLMKFKLYMNRAVNYASIFNSGMLLFLVLVKLKEVGYITWDLDKYFIIIFITGFVLLLFIGWLEINIFKGIQEENNIGFSLTPPLVDMKNKIDYLYNKEKNGN